MNLAAPLAAPDSETSTLFNPAFCAVVLNSATKDYEAKSGEAMPIVYAFLILPSALHKPTRAALPSTTASSMWGWLRANPVVLVDFTDRVRTFRSLTAAAMVFGLQHAVLTASPGSIAAGKIGRRPRTLRPTEDWIACLKAAEFLGRWFGGTDADEATTLARWGVRP
ncbi:hypothetical protein A5669_15825 [Mycolicibacterium fortuitum]|uniref:three component ABC system middle component n=1 Tax=Mycolicibacterium fortuitum TaxID=1766 RepID=UPI0007E98489|nr:three component ABC system middle component [Mycolicibacterium fortuitum]OBG56592.1 hypothetical protein A5669_15825 [Mycolicibacterium fortuitum]